MSATHRTLGNPYFDPMAEDERLRWEFFGEPTPEHVAEVAASLARKEAAARARGGAPVPLAGTRGAAGCAGGERKWRDR